MDPGTVDNIKSTMMKLINDSAAVEARTNLSNSQKKDMKSDIIVELFSFAITKPKFLAMHPRFRKALKEKAEEFLQLDVSDDLKEKARELLNKLINLPADPDYVADGGRRVRRRRSLRRKSRKGLKSRRRRST